MIHNLSRTSVTINYFAAIAAAVMNNEEVGCKEVKVKENVCAK